MCNSRNFKCFGQCCIKNSVNCIFLARNIKPFPCQKSSEMSRNTKLGVCRKYIENCKLLTNPLNVVSTLLHMSEPAVPVLTLSRAINAQELHHKSIRLHHLKQVSNKAIYKQEQWFCFWLCAVFHINVINTQKDRFEPSSPTKLTQRFYTEREIRFHAH